MSLNIKDREAHKLARALAAETGETMTAAVTRALRERLERVRKRRRSESTLADLIALGKRGAKLPQKPFDEDSLYDENGFPK